MGLIRWRNCYVFIRLHLIFFLDSRKTFDDSICIGVDANRNFGYEWGGEGASNVTCSDSYDGPEPFSESETQAIRDLLLGLGDQVAFYQNTHSYSQLIMYPWGYTEDLPEDADDQDNLATIVRKIINSHHCS